MKEKYENEGQLEFIRLKQAALAVLLAVLAGGISIVAGLRAQRLAGEESQLEDEPSLEDPNILDSTEPVIIIGEDGTVIHAPKVTGEGRFFQEYYAIGYTQDKKQYQVYIVEPTRIETPDGVQYVTPDGFYIGYDEYGKAYCYRYEHLLNENISLSPEGEVLSRRKLN